ncbi:MAG: chloride channel protein [Oscillospiraceae bacterium]|nr:chloride channel protein [Oscillospiraceae bacterium]
MKDKNNARLRVAGFALVCGASMGVLLWLYMKLISSGTHLVWDLGPGDMDRRLYTLLVCLCGGLVIGLMHVLFGNYPETMEEAFARLRRDRRSPYHKIFINAFTALMPLILGGSVGPMAGLTSMVISLMYWSEDWMRCLNYTLVTKGGSDTEFLGELFSREPPEHSDIPVEPPSRAALLWTLLIGAAAAAFALMCAFFGGALQLLRVPMHSVGAQEISFIPFLLAIGFGLGWLYLYIRKGMRLFFGEMKKRGKHVRCGLIGGACLGIVGVLAPMCMFSGQNETMELLGGYTGVSTLTLIVMGFVKLVLINICIESGWKGGHWFPVVFACMSFGIALGRVFGIDPIFACIMLSGIILTMIQRIPVPMAVSLLTCFPLRALPWLLLACFAGSLLPGPGRRSVSELADRGREILGFFCVKSKLHAIFSAVFGA